MGALRESVCPYHPWRVYHRLLHLLLVAWASPRLFISTITCNRRRIPCHLRPSSVPDSRALPPCSSSCTLHRPRHLLLGSVHSVLDEVEFHGRNNANCWPPRRSQRRPALASARQP